MYVNLEDDQGGGSLFTTEALEKSVHKKPPKENRGEYRKHVLDRDTRLLPLLPTTVAPQPVTLVHSSLAAEKTATYSPITSPKVNKAKLLHQFSYSPHKHNCH